MLLASCTNQSQSCQIHNRAYFYMLAFSAGIITAHSIQINNLQSFGRLVFAISMLSPNPMNFDNFLFYICTNTEHKPKMGCIARNTRHLIVGRARMSVDLMTRSRHGAAEPLTRAQRSLIHAHMQRAHTALTYTHRVCVTLRSQQLI